MDIETRFKVRGFWRREATTMGDSIRGVVIRSTCFLLGAALVQLVLLGCGAGSPDQSNAAKAAQVQGTWKFDSVGGGTSEDREVGSELEATLELSSDRTFIYESIFVGNDGWHQEGHGRWSIEDKVVVLKYEEKDGQPLPASRTSRCGRTS